MKQFVASCIQIAIEPNNIKSNVDKMCTWIEKSKKDFDSELILLPETISTGFTPNMPNEDFYDLLVKAEPYHLSPIQKIAKDLKTHIVYPVYEPGDKDSCEILNTSYLIDDNGEILGKYRKTHPFPTERKEGGGWTTPGRDTVVVETKLGNIGMIICYDGDFPELSRVCALKGAEIITRPSALLRSYDVWELTNKARAYDNHVYFMASNCVGPDAGNNFYFGHSMIVSPIGQIQALARGAEEIIATELNPDPIKYVSYGTKSPMIFDHLEDRNIHAYEGIMTEGKSRFEPFRRIPYRK